MISLAETKFELSLFMKLVVNNFTVSFNHSMVPVSFVDMALLYYTDYNVVDMQSLMYN